MTKARAVLPVLCLFALVGVSLFGRDPAAAQAPVRKPIFLAAGEGRHPGATPDDTFVFKLGGGESGSTFEVAESRIRPDAGPPLHIHDTEDEAFYVVSGTFRVRVGDQTAESGPGAFVFAPRGLPHAFVNIGAADGTLLTLTSPTTFEAFWQETATASRGLTPGTPEFDKAMAAVAAKHNKRVVGPPLTEKR